MAALLPKELVGTVAWLAQSSSLLPGVEECGTRWIVGALLHKQENGGSPGGKLWEGMGNSFRHEVFFLPFQPAQ